MAGSVMKQELSEEVVTVPAVSESVGTGDSQVEFYTSRDYSQPYPLPVQRVIPSHPCPTERYFDVRFYVPCLSDHAKEFRNAADQVLLFHSNRICLISLSPHHPVLDLNDAGKEIQSIHFEGEDGFGNRLENKVSGKKKHGGQKLKERSIICRIECRDGSSFHVLTGMKGKLVEINENLLSNPNLLRSDPWSRGYIAIVMATIARVQGLKDSLLSPEAYELVLQKRKETKDPEPVNKKHKADDEAVSSETS